MAAKILLFVYIYKQYFLFSSKYFDFYIPFVPSLFTGSPQFCVLYPNQYGAHCPYFASRLHCAVLTYELHGYCFVLRSHYILLAKCQFFFTPTLPRQYRDNFEPLCQYHKYKMLAIITYQYHIVSIRSICQSPSALLYISCSAEGHISVVIPSVDLQKLNDRLGIKYTPYIPLCLICDNTRQRGPHKSVDVMGCSQRPFHTSTPQ